MRKSTDTANVHKEESSVCLVFNGPCVISWQFHLVPTGQMSASEIPLSPLPQHTFGNFSTEAKAELRETGLHFQSYFSFHSIAKDCAHK